MISISVHDLVCVVVQTQIITQYLLCVSLCVLSSSWLMWNKILEKILLWEDFCQNSTLRFMQLLYLAPLTCHIEYVTLLWGCHGLWVLFLQNRVRENSDHTVLDGNVFSYNTYSLQVLNIQFCPVLFWKKRLNDLKVFVLSVVLRLLYSWNYFFNSLNYRWSCFFFPVSSKFLDCLWSPYCHVPANLPHLWQDQGCCISPERYNYWW